MGWALPCWVGLSCLGEALPRRQDGEGRGAAGDSGGDLGVRLLIGPWVTAVTWGPLGQLRASWIRPWTSRSFWCLGTRCLMGPGLQGC